LDKAFSELLAGAKERFGEHSVYVAADHNEYITGIPCPLSWAWFTGGADVVPLGRILGCDGKSGAGKSALMYEHCKWWIRSGGAAVIIDTEEKTSDTLLTSLLFDLTVEERRRLLYMKAGSIEEAQAMVMYYRERAKMFKEFKAEERIPLFVLWDSLVGRATDDQQTKIEKEGSAASREYPQEAMSIAKFYKALKFEGRLLTIAHVQHAKKNTDPNAMGDDEWKAAGGDQPRFSSTYHFRTLFTRDIESEQWQGRVLNLKNIKSGLGPNHRKLQVRYLWRYVPVTMPLFDDGPDGPEVKLTDAEISREDAQLFYDACTWALKPSYCDALYKALQLDVPPEPEDAKVKTKRFLPVSEECRKQQTWFDWDWALGNLLVEMRYGDLLFAKDKEGLGDVLHFVADSGKKEVKCEALFGDKEMHSVTEFGHAVENNPEVRDALRRFLGIQHYKSFREAS